MKEDIGYKNRFKYQRRYKQDRIGYFSIEKKKNLLFEEEKVVLKKEVVIDFFCFLC